jgi:4-amino-4-deoxy-L-arabinose transferase-like glycosyltransferase
MFLFAFLYAQSLRTAFFQIDELEFVKKGLFYELFFLHRDTDNPQWTTLANDPRQPKVGPYIYGAVLHAAGYRDIAAYFSQYDTFKEGKTVRWDLWLWKEPDQLPKAVRSTLPLVFVSRRVSLVFTLAMFAIVYLLSRLIGGYLSGLIALFLLGSNPLFRVHGFFAMTDSFLLFFFSVGLLTAFELLRSLKSQEVHVQNRAYTLSVLFGVWCALAVGVKITGILLFGFGLIGLALLFFLPHAIVQKKKTLIVHAIIMTITFLTIFIALHPFLYHDTLPRLRMMFVGRLESALTYQKIYPSTAVTTRVQAFKLVIGKTLLSGGYGNFHVGGIPIDLFLFLAGVVLLGKAIYRSYRRTHKVADESILLLWAFVTHVSIVAYLRNDWPRYYLPSIMVVTLVEAYALTVFLRLFRKFLDFLIPYAVNALHSFRIV